MIQILAQTLGPQYKVILCITGTVMHSDPHPSVRSCLSLISSVGQNLTPEPSVLNPRAGQCRTKCVLACCAGAETSEAGKALLSHHTTWGVVSPDHNPHLVSHSHHSPGVRRQPRAGPGRSRPLWVPSSPWASPLWILSSPWAGGAPGTEKQPCLAAPSSRGTGETGAAQCDSASPAAERKPRVSANR